jgi:hypothetical protein
MGCIFLVLIVGLGFGFDWVDIGLDLVNIFLSKTTKKLGLFYQKLVYLSMFFVGFIVINQVIGWADPQNPSG